MSKPVTEPEIPFVPDNAEAAYQNMLAQVPYGDCPSQYWAHQYCQYVATKGQSNADTPAKTMRWMAAQWRERKDPVPIKVQEDSTDTPTKSVAQPRTAKRRQATGRVLIIGQARREASRAKYPLYVAAYRELGAIRHVAKEFHASLKTVRKALIEAGIEIDPAPHQCKAYDLPELPSLYSSGLPMKDIAQQLGVSYPLIQKRVQELVKAGIVQKRDVQTLSSTNGTN